MNIFLHLLEIFKFTYTSIAANSGGDDFLTGVQTNHNVSNTSDEIKEKEIMLTPIMKEIILKVFNEKYIANRILLLENIHDTSLNLTDEHDIVTKRLNYLCMNEKEKSTNYSTKEYANDFLFKLKVIIEELYDEMYHNYRAGQDDEFYSLGMLNDIYFLNEVVIEYFSKFGYKIIQLTNDLLLVYYLIASRLSDGATRNKIDKIIARIKKQIYTLRKSISQFSKTFTVLNNIMMSMPDLRLPYEEQSLPTLPKKSRKSSIISCIGEYKLPRTNKSPDKILQIALLSIKFKDSIDMNEIYENLKNLRNNWIAGNYTQTELEAVFILYFISFSIQYPFLIPAIKSNLGDTSKYMGNLFSQQKIADYSFPKFLITFLPKYLANVLATWDSDFFNPTFLMLCYQKFVRIIDYRRYLISDNTASFIYLFTLNPDEQLLCIKAVIDCYNTYLLYINNIYRATNIIITYDLEALNSISRIIHYHLESIDPIIFSNDIKKYVQLCLNLKELTTEIIQHRNQQTSTVFSDYTHLIKFYEKYHENGLNINCIYNICFLLGKSFNGTELRLYRNCDGNKNSFYYAANMFILKLSNLQYETLNYCEETNDTLEYIMRRIVDITHGYTADPHIINDCIKNEAALFIDTRLSKSDVQCLIGILESAFWSKRYLYLYILNIYEYKNYSLKTMYLANYVSDLDVGRLYHACYDFTVSKNAGYVCRLQLGVINMINKKRAGEVLCDIIFNAFVLVKETSEKYEKSVEGCEMIQILFRSLNYNTSMDIRKRIVNHIILDNDEGIKDEIMDLIYVLGIYILFSEVKSTYLTLFRSRLIINKILASVKPTRPIYVRGYQVLQNYCYSLEEKVLKCIAQPNICSLLNVSTQLSHTLEALESAGNDSVVISELLLFVAKIISTTYLHTREPVQFLIANVLEHLSYVIASADCNPILHLTLFYCKSILDMLKIIIQNIKKLSSTNLSLFIEFGCSCLVAFSCNIKSHIAVQQRDILKFENLKSVYILLIADLERL